MAGRRKTVAIGNSFRVRRGTCWVKLNDGPMAGDYERVTADEWLIIEVTKGEHLGRHAYYQLIEGRPSKEKMWDQDAIVTKKSPDGIYGFKRILPVTDFNNTMIANHGRFQQALEEKRGRLDSTYARLRSEQFQPVQSASTETGRRSG